MRSAYEKFYIFFYIFDSFFCNSLSVTAKSGYCSHHKGVAGCNSSGRQICKDDGSCILKNYGCTDIKAINYDDRANIDDHSCKYKSIGELNNVNHNLLDVIFWIVSKIISNII